MKLLEYITKKPRIFQRFVGLKINEFEIFTNKVEKCHKKQMREINNKVERKRRIGGGRQSKILGIKEKLIIILLYYKLYLTQEFLGVIFGIDQSNISRIISSMAKLIEESADPMMNKYLEEAKAEIPNGRASISDMATFLRKYPELEEIMTDCTESPCRRPNTKEENKKYYSGKKKRHTEKTQITISSTGKILDVSNSYPGSTHDKKIFDFEKTVDKTTRFSRHFMDKGYCGADKEHGDKNILIPFKRKKKTDLTPFQKQINSYIGKNRIQVEHIIGKLKNFRIISDVFRGDKDEFNQTFRNIAAIWNFKLMVSST